MKIILFIDFDGVLCDSALECFVSSLSAHAEMNGRTEPDRIELERKRLFYRYRPLIRNGEDYLLIHEMIERGVDVCSQADFDEQISLAGPVRMQACKAAFYRARQRMMGLDRAWWFGLNRLYQPLDRCLQGLGQTPGAYVLSTKKPEFIAEILEFSGIDWPKERLLYPGERSKAEVIRDILDRDRAGRGIFIDDHLGQLKHARQQAPISAYLAGWGYVMPDWLEQKDVPILDIGSACTLLGAFTGGRPDEFNLLPAR